MLSGIVSARKERYRASGNDAGFSAGRTGVARGDTSAIRVGVACEASMTLDRMERFEGRPLREPFLTMTAG